MRTPKGKKLYCTKCGATLIEEVALVKKWFDQDSGKPKEKIYRKWKCPNTPPIIGWLTDHDDIDETRSMDGGGGFL